MNTLIGERFFVGIPGPTLDPDTRKVLKEVQPGGIILFARNVRSASQLAHLTSNLRSLLGRHLSICLDHEGGRVNRLKDLTGVVPSALQLGFLDNETWARRHGTLTGRLLHEVGVNVNLAPVLDLHLRPKTDNSVPDRCWSRNPRKIAQLAGAFLKGMQQEGVSGCGKHFLGYGAADKDPHLLLPRVNRTRIEILQQDLRPYALLSRKNKKPLKKELQMIMLSHAHLRAFHGSKLTPASISPIIAGTLLRETLGFQGVSITDDLEMGAILKQMAVDEAAVRCLAVGIDFILVCHTAKAIRACYRTSLRAFKKGLFTEDSLRSSHHRVSRLQHAFPANRTFSQRRFDGVVKDIHAFTRQIFSKLPPELRVIDPRWGAIGEKY